MVRLLNHEHSEAQLRKVKKKIIERKKNIRKASANLS